MRIHTKQEVLLSDHIKAHLLKDNIFSIHGLEKRLSIPSHVLRNCLDNQKVIPPKHHEKLIDFLSSYGLKIEE